MGSDEVKNSFKIDYFYKIKLKFHDFVRSREKSIYKKITYQKKRFRDNSTQISYF